MIIFVSSFVNGDGTRRSERGRAMLPDVTAMMTRKAREAVMPLNMRLREGVVLTESVAIVWALHSLHRARLDRELTHGCGVIVVII